MPTQRNYVMACRDIFREWREEIQKEGKKVNKIERENLKTELLKIAKVMGVDSYWALLPGWVVERVSDVKLNTVASYLGTWSSVWEYADDLEASLECITREKYVELFLRDWNKRNTASINYAAIRSFSTFLKRHGFLLQLPSKTKIMGMVDDSPKLFEIPSEQQVREQVSVYANSIDDEEFIAAAYAVCAGFLGMRRSEIMNTSVDEYRIGYRKDGYEEVFGKGDKRRIIRFDVLTDEHIDILKKAFDKARDMKTKGLLMSCDTEGKLTYLHKKYWGHMAETGPHSFRHCFAIWMRHNHGMAYQEISCYLRHAALRTAQKSYDQYAYKRNIPYLQYRSEITQRYENLMPKEKLLLFLGYKKSQLPDPQVAREIKNQTGINMSRHPAGGMRFREVLNMLNENMVKSFCNKYPLADRVKGAVR